MAARQLLFGDDARERIRRGVDALAHAVKVTVGPRGLTVILERGFGPPQIVDSGVAVARSIEREDRFQNTGAQLLREVAARTPSPRCPDPVQKEPPMRTIRPNTPSLPALAAGLLLSAGLAAAQPASAPGAGPCRAGASAPAGTDCPRPMMRGGMGPGARWGQGYTFGWSMMSEAERQQHRDRLATLQTYDECRRTMDQHHDEMVARAKERGIAMPAQPRRDACAGLKPAAK